ncbi:M56 family metallopeptidase [Marinisporobacter balticus]|uniref:Beta-lactamase regulating signal transducer with metallopeptidase domain n=1 Tax=Marinisporobacter balticus TaxID=2018667 RepID=A0A4R2KES8_9FIRM|nr:M56 family metallopeptidase [Marinisporobacter balticus]TCO72151.1 beta-lactamase regulating signal transducer with metallopeptidase domain [Marinisporobacter balticus]
MIELFISVLNMSVTASYVILFVILVRLLLKKAPKVISYALWGVVAFRLIIPFSFESMFSLMPRNTHTVSIPHDIIYQQSPQINKGIEVVDSFVSQSLPAPTVEASVNPLQIYIEIGAYIWILGIMILLIYSVVSILLLERQLKSAQLIEQNIFEAKNLKTPFVLGLIRPKIYLPVGLNATERSYILLHEQTHINRKDHIIKIFAFLILSIHWFNPLVWIAFILMSTDMELSCDERVLKKMNEDIKKPYANSLLSLATGRHILNGNPLAFGEGNVRGRIKNVLNYKKFSFWVIAVSMITVIIVGIALVTNPKGGNTIQLKDNLAESPSGTTEAAYQEYNRVKIEFHSDMMGFKSANEFETTDSKIVAFTDSTLRTSLTPAKEDDLENNHTNQYTVKLSNNIGGYSCRLYYDTLYNKAYIVKDGGLYEVNTDFARYIDSFLENTSITVYIDNADAVALFQKYGWTLDYQISAMKNKLNNIKALSGFNPNAYYFAYNNELSKDIGLDMSGYSNTADIDVEIYRIHESMPQEFYPIQDCRGVVVKNDSKIIGAFIRAGRHSTFNACSLIGNSFEKVTRQTLNEWLVNMIQADDLEVSLSKLEPEQVIEEYFTALDNKDAKVAEYCILKKTLLGNLTSNMQNSELFNEGVGLPLTGASIGAASIFDNLKSAKLLKVELIDEPDEYTKIFRVTVDLQYNNEITISSGQQYWDCHMVYESPQTGWKIEGFGH